MNFLYPQFLYGLFALSIPIIVHLFNFRRTRKVYFSNTRFLKKVKETSSSKLRLKHYLILLSRLLFILFLVLAFAQPIIKSAEEITPQKDILVYLDNSFSMSNEVSESTTAFDASVIYLEEMLKLFPTETNYQLITNDFDPSSNVLKSKVEVSDLSTELQLSSISRTNQEVYNRISSQKNTPSNIYWLSDFQKSTSGNSTVNFDSTYTVNLVPLNFISTSNVAVDSVWLENPYLIGSEKLKLNVKLKNYGNSKVSDLIVKAFVDDVQSATASVDLEPKAIDELSFDLVYNLDGVNKCKISFEEFPVTFDNEFYFTINFSQKINVLEINSDLTDSNITNVFGNEKLFNLTNVNVSNLDYSLLEQNDLIVLNGLKSIDASLSIAINKQLDQLGSVIVIPSNSPDLKSYQQLYGFQSASLTDTLIQTTLQTPDFNNPFFANVFEEESKTIAMPSAKKLIDWGRDRNAILSLKNGEPFLSKLNVSGDMYVVAAPLNANYTNFYAHALFVPVMYKIAVESASTNNQLYYFTDESTIIYKSKSNTENEVYKLKNELEEVIPSQRIIGNNVYLEVPNQLLSAGYYDLMVNDEFVTAIAFNKNFKESDLSQLNKEEMAQSIQGNVSIIESENKGTFIKELENKYIGRELWKYAILLALLFLLTEVLLIRFLP